MVVLGILQEQGGGTPLTGYEGSGPASFFARYRDRSRAPADTGAGVLRRGFLTHASISARARGSNRAPGFFRL